MKNLNKERNNVTLNKQTINNNIVIIINNNPEKKNLDLQKIVNWAIIVVQIALMI